jgi:hypothetical protein
MGARMSQLKIGPKHFESLGRLDVDYNPIGVLEA